MHFQDVCTVLKVIIIKWLKKGVLFKIKLVDLLNGLKGRGCLVEYVGEEALRYRGLLVEEFNY